MPQGAHGAHGQCRLRVVVAIGCALAAATTAADDEPVTRRLAVWAIGLPDGGYVVMEHQSPTVGVTAEDVARGYVQVTAGSRFAITTGESAGYTVEFVTRGAWCRSVLIDGIGPTATLGPSGGTVVQPEPAAGRRVVALSYRFMLAPDVQPGSYAWPLDLVVRETAPGDAERESSLLRLASLTGRR